MSKRQIQHFTKGNRKQKELTKKEFEDMIVKNATGMIEQYNEAYENQISDLKKKHLKEFNGLNKKYKKARTYGFIALGLFVTQAIVTLIIILIEQT